MSSYGEYDLDSIMHCPGHGNGRPNGIPGMEQLFPLQYKWVDKFLVGPLASFYSQLGGDLGPPTPYALSRGDALAVCQIYNEECRKCWPSGVPSEPGEPCEGALPEPQPGPAPDLEEFITPPPPILAPQKPSKLTSGCTLAIGDFFWTNSSADETAFIAVDGITSINTKCLPMTVSPNNSPENGQLAPKGWTFAFETQVPAQPPEVPDTCCLRVFTLAACDAGQGWSQVCSPISEQENGDPALTPMDIQSFQVFNCSGIWTGPFAE
ncbi:hypothetical protein NW759_016513 [Fusarium solani]|nr:hypothetical protein NW759_016513 [Fusarium solani]